MKKGKKGNDLKNPFVSAEDFTIYLERRFDQPLNEYAKKWILDNNNTIGTDPYYRHDLNDRPYTDEYHLKWLYNEYIESVERHFELGQWHDKMCHKKIYFIFSFTGYSDERVKQMTNKVYDIMYDEDGWWGHDPNIFYWVSHWYERD